jgi:hypothetical protein
MRAAKSRSSRFRGLRPQFGADPQPLQTQVHCAGRRIDPGRRRGGLRRHDGARFPDRDAFPAWMAQLSGPRAGPQVAADEAKFLDRSRTRAYVVDEHGVVTRFADVSDGCTRRWTKMDANFAIRRIRTRRCAIAQWSDFRSLVVSSPQTTSPCPGPAARFTARSAETPNRCRLELDGYDRLRLRGYVGIPLVGRTTTWTRVGSDKTKCAQ